MAALYQSPITQAPLLSSDQLAAIQKSFAPTQSTAGVGTTLPGVPVDPSAAAYINQNFSDAKNIDNSAAGVAFTQQYQPKATDLYNTQQNVVTQDSLAGLQYDLGQQQQSLGRLNQGRQFQLGNMDFLGNLLGGLS